MTKKLKMAPVGNGRDLLSPGDDGKLYAKRRRQRMHVKQAYDRDKNKLTALRHHVHTLEHQYIDLIVELSTLVLASTQDSKPSTMEDAWRDGIVEGIKALTTTTEQLTSENESLQTACSVFTRMYQRLQHMATSNTMRYHFRPLPGAELHRVVNKARAHMYSVLDGPTMAVCGPDIVGWRHQHRKIDEDLTFTLAKTFRCSSHQLWQRTWALLSTPDKYVELYSASVGPQLQLLHQIDDNTLLYYTRLTASASVAPLQSVYLLRREQYKGFSLIYAHSIDHRHVRFEEDQLNEIVDDVRQQQRHGQSRWTTELFAWLVFEEKESGLSEFHLYGSCHKAWELEVVMLAQRWQIHVVGHERVLPSERT